jgi:hypothetical protein
LNQKAVYFIFRNNSDNDFHKTQHERFEGQKQTKSKEARCGQASTETNRPGKWNRLYIAATSKLRESGATSISK